MINAGKRVRSHKPRGRHSAIPAFPALDFPDTVPYSPGRQHRQKIEQQQEKSQVFKVNMNRSR